MIRADVLAAFQVFDKHGIGALSKSEVLAILTRVDTGFGLDSDQAVKLVDVHADKAGNVDIAQVASAWSSSCQASSSSSTAEVLARCTVSTVDTSVTLSPGVDVVIAQAVATTRHDVMDAISDAEIEMDDWGEATVTSNLPDGGWLFEAVNDPEPGEPMRFIVAARLVLGGKAYTAAASVDTLAQQKDVSAFCRQLAVLPSAGASIMPDAGVA